MHLSPPQMAIMKASDSLFSFRQTSSAASKLPSMSARVTLVSASDSAPVYTWNGLLVFAPLDAARSERKLPSSVDWSKNDAPSSTFPLVWTSFFSSATSSSFLSANPRYSTNLLRGFSEVSVSMTVQSAFSSSFAALAIFDSQMEPRSPVSRALSNSSLALLIAESTANVEIVTLDFESTMPNRTSFPPKPKATPALLFSHFGGAFSEKDAPWGSA